MSRTSPGPALTPRSGRARRARRLTAHASRVERREFLAEGPQAVREALLDSGAVEVFGSRSATERHPDLVTLATGQGVSWTVAEDTVVATLSDTVTPQGVVAVCRFVDVSLSELVVPGVRLLAMCADVRDPGNAGTVIRCADAAGADGVLLTGSSVDPYNPKAVRASAGSLFHLPLCVEPDPATAIAAARSAGLTVLAAEADADLDLVRADTDGLLARPTAWLFGNEARGLPIEVLALADRIVSVPIYGRAESLNLATAAAVCLYASALAQRRNSSPAAEGPLSQRPRTH